MSHYLDHAATSPLDPAALEAWVAAQRELGAVPGNPAALHSGGRRARRMLDDARERVAHQLGADIHEVLFTSGATESDALGVMAAARGARASDPARTRILVSSVEHDAVANQRAVADREGFAWEELPVAPTGTTPIDEAALAALAPSVAVASMCLVCSETGAVQPVAALARAMRAGGARTHTDAAQAVPVVEVRFDELGVDLMSVAGHKAGAPVGVGCLVARRGIPALTDRPGGGHERGLRSGTPDVAGALALAAALEATTARRRAFASRTAALRQRLLAALPPGCAPTVAPADAVPSIIHLSIPTSRPEAVLMAMDMAGVVVSAGSACHAGVARPSRVVMAMGRDEASALGVLRVSLGAATTEDDIDALIAALPAAVRAGQALEGAPRARNTRNQEAH